MAKKQQNAINPSRAENYPEWYQQVIRAADLAEVSPVRGCMVIKPWGYSIWENMQAVLGLHWTRLRLSVILVLLVDLGQSQDQLLLHSQIHPMLTSYIQFVTWWKKQVFFLYRFECKQ